ncbi:hypothetical protein CBW24_01425 [Pacificitalea manganoxidans]|uniref:Transglycosylase SLT domain-containing protein n=1 Tax=Pacificitalea manganoxidans TaxID=1411902 RepID=A0A291LVT3_9RHOB|nr:hypothetical protein CBW24_01425 [Pacificitalea manganoxidans]
MSAEPTPAGAGCQVCELRASGSCPILKKIWGFSVILTLLVRLPSRHGVAVALFTLLAASVGVGLTGASYAVAQEGDPEPNANRTPPAARPAPLHANVASNADVSPEAVKARLDEITSPTRIAALRTTLAALSQGDWLAAGLGAVPGGPDLATLVEWYRLRSAVGEFADYQAFLTDHADWPGLAYLRSQGEGSIRPEADPEQVIAYFGDDLPDTGHGFLRLIAANRALGRDGEAEVLAVMAWRAHELTPDTEQELLSLYGDTLKEHHEARLDWLLWQAEWSAAQRMYPKVSDGWQKLAAARSALRRQAAGVDTLIEAVPEDMQDDPGLAFERFNWRARKGRNEDATALLATSSVSQAALGEPSFWSNWRRIYARMEMRAGNYEGAYQLASRHYLASGGDFADLEWLAGYLSLVHLDDAERALVHFTRFDEAVETPISRSRAGYWLGRAHEALGDDAAAKAAYAEGAQYQSAFYGLLAAEKLGQPLDPIMAGGEVFPNWIQTSFAESSVFTIGMLMVAAGEEHQSERFLTHLVEGLDRTEAGALGTLIISQEKPHLAVMVAKRAAEGGMILPAAYYPLHPLAERADLPVDPALALSIARRESEFDPAVQSPVGARGLMQLMPGTAKDVAGELGLPYNLARLTSDPVYNARLGSAYLAGLIEIFGDTPSMVAAGYNAGPGRPVRWAEERGDPRDPDIDVVDWIEMIPFRETRNYVMRVSESIPIYRARLNGAPSAPLQFTAMLKGQQKPTEEAMAGE